MKTELFGKEALECGTLVEGTQYCNRKEYPEDPQETGFFRVIEKIKVGEEKAWDREDIRISMSGMWYGYFSDAYDTRFRFGQFDPQKYEEMCRLMCTGADLSGYLEVDHHEWEDGVDDDRYDCGIEPVSHIRLVAKAFHMKSVRTFGTLIRDRQVAGMFEEYRESFCKEGRDYEFYHDGDGKNRGCGNDYTLYLAEDGRWYRKRCDGQSDVTVIEYGGFDPSGYAELCKLVADGEDWRNVLGKGKYCSDMEEEFWVIDREFQSLHKDKFESRIMEEESRNYPEPVKFVPRKENSMMDIDIECHPAPAPRVEEEEGDLNWDFICQGKR